MMLGFYVARFTGLKALEFRIPSPSGLGYQYVARYAGSCRKIFAACEDFQRE
jgi:hypothetical protein